MAITRATVVSLLVGITGCSGVAGVPGVGDISSLAGSTGLSNIPGLKSLADSRGVPSKGGAGSKDKQKAELQGIESDVPRILNDIAGGKTYPIDDILADDKDGGDAALARSERGRIAQIEADSKGSIPEFEEAINKIKEFEDRATVSLSDVGSHAAALVVNDNMISYEPAGFERVFVYHFQALNYLMQGNLEGAGVEVRRANAEQERALKAHADEVAAAEKEAKEKGFKVSDIQAGLNKSLGGSKAVGAQVKNSFQNAYTFYMSAVVHELMKEPGDAYIDYKKALEIYPKNSFIQRDVARLAKSLAMTDDIARFSKLYRQAFNAAAPTDPAKTEVVVLFEDGLVPGKSVVWFPIPIPIPSAPGLTTVAIPTFKASVAPVAPLTVKADGVSLGATERICATDALAVKAYEESAPAMITRQIVRAAIKGTASSMASKYGGGLAGAAVATINTLTEVADTRSWRSLPLNAQILRVSAKPGASLNLVHAGSGASGTLTLPVEPGKRVVARAIRAGGKLFIQSASF